MARDAVLSIKILTDATNAQKGFKDAESSVGKFQSGITKAAVPAAAALAAVGAVALSAASAAAEDQQAQAVLANTLRKTAGATDAQIASTEDWISATAAATGVADDQLRPALGNLARATGSVSESQKAMAVALDVAAATGTDVETVSKAMAKAYAGNTGALKKLVPGMDKAVLAGGDMSAVMAELEKKTGGAAATAAGTAAGKMARFKLAMDETKESAGAVLLPALDKLGGVLVKVGGFAQDHSTAFVILAGAIAGIAGAVLVVNAALKVYQATLIVVQAVQKATWLSNPIGLVIAAVLLLVAGIVLLWKRSETFRRVVLAVWAAIKTAAAAVLRWLQAAWRAVFAAVSAYVRAYAAVFRAVFNAIRVVASAVGNAIRAAWRVVMSLIGAYVRAYLTVFRVVFAAVRAVASAVIGWLRAAWAAVMASARAQVNYFRAVFASAFNAARTVAAAVAGAIRRTWEAVFGALRRAAGSIGAVLSRPFDIVRSAVNNVIGAIRDLISWFGRIRVPKISLPKIPGFNSTASVAAAPTVAPTGLAAASARAGGTTRASSPTSGAVVININGAIDPESTARQVRRILAAHDRRMGLGGSGLRAGTV